MMRKITLISVVLILSFVQLKAQDYKFQALFLYNFTKYIQWPAQTSNISDFEIVTLGKIEINDQLSKFLSNKTVAGQKIVVRHARTAKEIGSPRIVFVSQDASGQISEVVEQINKRPILLVAEKNTAFAGGNITLMQHDGKMGFEIDMKNSEKQGFKISNQLARLAE